MVDDNAKGLLDKADQITRINTRLDWTVFL
jgi:hypothetical protein